MDIPKLKQGECSVIRAELSTGIILDNDDTYYQSSGNNYYQVFSSISEAKDYIKNNDDSSKIECEYGIYDYAGNFIEIIKGSKKKEYIILDKTAELKLIVTPVIGLFGKKYSYRLSDGAYGEWLIYNENFPIYYFNIFDDLYSDIKTSLLELKVDIGNFIEENLKRTYPILTTKEHLFGFRLHNSEKIEKFLIKKLPPKLLLPFSKS